MTSYIAIYTAISLQRLRRAVDSDKFVKSGIIEVRVGPNPDSQNTLRCF